MEFDTYLNWVSGPVQIAFLDLVLGADNAVIIALVCRTLPRRQRTNVMIVGTGAAMLLRLMLTAMTGALMFVPLLRIAGGALLLLIAVGLVDELDFVEPTGADEEDDGGPVDPQLASEAFWDAILLVVIADGVMSLDNTVALAAVAKGDVGFLILGLALSVPTLVFGSWLLTELLNSTPVLSRFAMGVLGWVAGDMVVSDPLIAGWIRDEAPALTYAVPIAAVTFVILQGSIHARRASELLARPPASQDGVVDWDEGEPVAPVAGVVQAAAEERQPKVLESVAPQAAATPPAPSALPGAVVEAVPAPAEAVSIVAVDATVPGPVATSPDLPLETEDAAEEVAAGRSREERLVLIGLGGLLVAAAILISLAIAIGGDASF